MIKDKGLWLPSTDTVRKDGTYKGGLHFTRHMGVWKPYSVKDTGPAAVFELMSTQATTVLVTSKNLQAAPASARLYEVNTTTGVRTLKKTTDLLSNGTGANFGTLEANKTYQLEFDTLVGLDPSDVQQTYLQFAKNAYVRKILKFNRETYRINRYPIPYSTVLTEVPTYLPPFCKSLNAVFYEATIFNQASIALWDTSKITWWEDMFYYAVTFNRNVSGWNTDAAISWARWTAGANAFQAANKPARFR